jgi:hypothetical protein
MLLDLYWLYIKKRGKVQALLQKERKKITKLVPKLEPLAIVQYMGNIFFLPDG